MHSAKIASVVLGALLFTVGCSPLRGWAYTNVTEPGLVETGAHYGFGNRSLAHYELDNGMGPGSKVGEANVQNVLYTAAWGDASVEGACKAGGITKIHTIDTHFVNYWIAYMVTTVRVTGE